MESLLEKTWRTWSHETRRRLGASALVVGAGIMPMSGSDADPVPVIPFSARCLDVGAMQFGDRLLVAAEADIKGRAEFKGIEFTLLSTDQNPTTYGALTSRDVSAQEYMDIPSAAKGRDAVLTATVQYERRGKVGHVSDDCQMPVRLPG